MFDEFFDGYLECLLWQSNHWAGMVDGDDNPEPLGDVLDGTEEWAPGELDGIRLDVQDFYDSNLSDLKDAFEIRQRWDYLGHDFCLSRNRHGTGFWDRGLGDIGDRLHAAAAVYGDAAADLVDGQLISV